MSKATVRLMEITFLKDFLLSVFRRVKERISLLPQVARLQSLLLQVLEQSASYVGLVN